MTEEHQSENTEVIEETEDQKPKVNHIIIEVKDNIMRVSDSIVER